MTLASSKCEETLHQYIQWLIFQPAHQVFNRGLSRSSQSKVSSWAGQRSLESVCAVPDLAENWVGECNQLAMERKEADGFL